jgi:DnaK suppressor protein
MHHDERTRDVALPPVRSGESPWTAEELQALRIRLAADAEELQVEIDATEESVYAVQHGDCALDGTDPESARTALEKLRERRDNARARYAQTLAALERLHTGTFGFCASCGRPIGRTRVSALPHVDLCIDCQQQRESALRTAS